MSRLLRFLGLACAACAIFLLSSVAFGGQEEQTSKPTLSSQAPLKQQTREKLISLGEFPCSEYDSWTGGTKSLRCWEDCTAASKKQYQDYLEKNDYDLNVDCEAVVPEISIDEFHKTASTTLQTFVFPRFNANLLVTCFLRKRKDRVVARRWRDCDAIDAMLLRAAKAGSALTESQLRQLKFYEESDCVATLEKDEADLPPETLFKSVNQLQCRARRQ